MAETETERKLRIRAEQAEAEVRSLKRTRHERSDRAEVTTRVETSRLDFGTQTDSHETEIAEPRERLKNTPAPSEGSPVSEIEELRQQLKQRDSAIVQLQADRNREQHTKQRKASEETTLCREELCEMTQRAESLMEQLRKSKKRGGELQAARELAREEFLTCRSELQECQATLRRQVVRSDGSEPTYESREARGSLRSSEKESDVTTSLMDSKDTAPIGEQFTLRPPEWKGAPGQARLSQCFGTLRKLHHELSKELQSRSKSQGKPEDVVSKLLQQMDKALQLDGPSPVGSEGRAVAVSLSGLRQPSSPEAERPLPEDLKDFKLSTSSASAGSPQPRDSEEVLLMKLDVNAVRVAAELEKKKLMDQHCDDMDDLLRRHNKERRELHQELVELRSEQLRSEAHETLVKPMQDIRAHFEKQVAEVKHGLKAELADIHEQNRMLNGQVEQEMSLLRRDLERSQGELFASKHQFRELEGLYDKEHSELLRLRQQQRELMEKEEQAKAAAAEAAANTFDVQQAEANATLSGDFSHDTATAILPVGVAPTLERSQERPEGKEDQVSGSNNTTLLADDSQQTAAHPQVNSSIPSPLPAPNSAMKQVMMAPKPKEDGREAMTPTVLSTRKAARPSVTAVSTVLRTIPSQGRPATVQTRSAPQLPTPSTPHGVRPVLSAGPAQLHRLTNTPTTTTLIQHHHRSLSSASG